MESVEFMSPSLSQITATRGKGQAGDDDECGDGTIANSVFAIPAADHQARVSISRKRHYLHYFGNKLGVLTQSSFELLTRHPDISQHGRTSRSRRTGP